MDALTHNIESYLSPAYHPLCDGIALEGTRIAAAALLTAVNEPTNLQARSDMMMSSMMGAIAFQKDLGAVHSCAHALGAVCDLHHGLANALMIDTVMAWNYESRRQKFDELAHVCGVAGGGKAFVPWLRALKASVGITGGLAAHGVKPEHLPRLVRDRHGRHLPPDQPAALHRGGLRGAVQGGDVNDGHASRPPEDRRQRLLLYPDPARTAFAPARRCSTSSSPVPHWVMSGGALPVMIPSPTGDTARGDVGFATTRSGSTAWCCMAAPTSGPAATARRRCRSAGTATATATNTRSRWCVPLPSWQAGVRHLPRPAAHQRGTAARCTRTSPPSAPGADAPRRGGLRPELPRPRRRARHRLATLLAGQPRRTINSVHHQGIKDLAPTSSSRRVARRRHDRGHPPHRHGPGSRRAMAPRVPQT
jgi:hypothetical protein